MTTFDSNLEPPRRRRNLPALPGPLRWLGGVVAEAARPPIVGAVTTVLIAAWAALADGLSQLVLAGLAVLTASMLSAFMMVRSRRRRFQELRELHDQEMAEQRREVAYGVVPRDVAEGLNYALHHPEIVIRGVVHFVERYALRPLAEAFQLALSIETGEPQRVELGIATQDGEGLTVTHGTGPYTKAMREDGPCVAAGKAIADVVAAKAASDWVPGGFLVVKLGGDRPNDYLFALASAPLGHVEKQALERHASFIRVSEIALMNIGLTP